MFLSLSANCGVGRKSGGFCCRRCCCCCFCCSSLVLVLVLFTRRRWALQATGLARGCGCIVYGVGLPLLIAYVATNDFFSTTCSGKGPAGRRLREGNCDKVSGGKGGGGVERDLSW